MGIDLSDVLAGLGGGLEGFVKYKAWDTDRKRKDEAEEREKKRDETLARDAEENRRLRKQIADAEEERRVAERRQRAMDALRDDGRMLGINLTNDTLGRAVEGKPFDPILSVDGAGPIWNTLRHEEVKDPIATAMKYLNESTQKNGERIALPNQMGYVQDETAARKAMERAAAAAKAAEDLARAKELERMRGDTRRDVAGIVAAARGGAGGAGDLNKQINDQEQVLGAAAKAVPTERPPMARVLPGGQPIDPDLAARFVADSTGKAAVAGREREKLDALKVLRGDFTAMQRGMPGVPGGPGGPVPLGGKPTMDPATQQQMASELAAVSQRVQRILSNPRATEQDKAVARAELERRQREIVARYQGGGR